MIGNLGNNGQSVLLEAQRQTELECLQIKCQWLAFRNRGALLTPRNRAEARNADIENAAQIQILNKVTGKIAD